MRRLIVSTHMSLDGVIEAPDRWGSQNWNDTSGIATRMIELPKLVASTSLEHVAWDATLVGRDVPEAVAHQ